MISSAPSSRKLSAAELQTRLDQALFASPSYRSARGLPATLEPLPRSRQEQVLHWAAVSAESSTELGYQLAARGAAAAALLDHAAFEDWALAALEACDLHGFQAGVALVHAVDSFAAGRRGHGIAYSEVEARLTRFIQGLAGRPLALAPGARAWTDSETITLPTQVDAQADSATNRRLYKVLATMLWAQTRYGGFGSATVDLAAGLAPWLDSPLRERALGWLAALESVRLEAQIALELPGLGAEIAAARGPWPPALQPMLARLSAPAATLADSLALLAGCLAGDGDAPPLPHAPAFEPEAALARRAGRIAGDLEVLRRAFKVMQGSGDGGEAGKPTTRLDAQGPGAEICLNGESLDLPAEAQAAAHSLLQDLGELPPECLRPAGAGPWRPEESDDTGSAPVVVENGRADARYDEWDYRRKAYRRDWCQLYEMDCGTGDLDYVSGVKSRHRGLIHQLRRRFEMLRSEDRMLGRQNEGEEIDLDAAVDAIADRKSGVEPSPNLFRRRVRNQRSLAAMFMVDMSGSTKGWVNDAEREALVLLCEALEALGDAYAIYGFSGMTRRRCEIYRIKRFAEGYSAEVRARIAAIAAKDYTRMGVAVRHLTKLLLAEPARHRLLVTLSDGRPDDYGDEYRGHYGVEDTRRALQEAHRAGVRSFCITIDRHGADYLAHMYGSARYAVLDDVRQLPLKLADIYQRLSS